MSFRRQESHGYGFKEILNGQACKKGDFWRSLRFGHFDSPLLLLVGSVAVSSTCVLEDSGAISRYFYPKDDLLMRKVRSLRQNSLLQR